MRRIPATTLLVLASALLVLLLASCGDGGSAPASPSPVVSGTHARERVIGPFTWRTTDGFTSVRAGEPYKVVLRVTSGYDEPTLPIVAAPEEGDTIEFEATRVEPVDGESGSFYTFRLELPEPGRWTVSATAGRAAASVQVDVQPAPGHAPS